jgi:hypothetical protein
MKTEQIPRVFFAAMRRKYTETEQEGAVAKPVPEVLLEADHFKVLYYLATIGSYRFERFIVLYDGVPVWTMSCQGLYMENAIPFLRRALLKAYNRREFIGGRGPRVDTDGELVYENTVEEGPNSWKRFRGRDRICDGNDQNIGWCEYQGEILVE